MLLNDDVTVVVGLGGELSFVYADELRPLVDLRPDVPFADKVRRASHVEPDGDGWTADMTPSGGIRLGPYPTRAAALAAERSWLNGRI